MELDISNDAKISDDIDLKSFIKELENEIDTKEVKKITIKDIKIDKNSDLSLVNNIAKNNKMTNQNREEFFSNEISSIWDTWRNNKRAGTLYYIASNGIDNNFYTYRVDDNYHKERVEIINKAEFPENAKPGEIYRKKNGKEIHLSKDETKEHEKKMKSVAKKILNKQETEGGYKREFSKKNLELGNGYEGEYFQYETSISEELGKQAGIPTTMIKNYLEKDIDQVFEDSAKELSKGDTIYTAMPNVFNTLYEISDGNIKRTDIKNKNCWEDGFIFKSNKSGELVKDEELTKVFQQKVLEKLETTVKNKYDEICKDYKKEGHIYEVNKSVDENYVPTITIKDISENRFLELEDLDFIQNRYLDEGTYVVRDGEYYKINPNKKIPPNNTIDREKEDERNFANIMAKKYQVPKDIVEEKMKEFMIEKSKEYGVVVYIGYDKKKDK